MFSLIIAITLLLISNIYIFIKLKNKILVILFSQIIYIFFAISREFNIGFNFLDIADYERYFIMFVNAYKNNTLLEFISPHVPVYTILYSGWLYLLDGRDSFLAIRIINISICIISIIPLNGIGKIIFNKDLNNWQILVLLLWLPFTFRLGVEIGRTPISNLTLFLSIYCLLLGRKYIYWGILFSIIAIALRIPHIIFYIPIIYYLLNKKIKKKSILKSLAIFTIFISISLLFYFVFSEFSSESRNFQNIEELSNYTQERNLGNSAYLVDFFPSLNNLIIYIPIHTIYFYLSPMIWDAISTPLSIPSSVFSILLFLFLLNFIKNRKKLIVKRNIQKTILLSMLLSCILFGLVTKNAGSAERWRSPITFITLTIFTYYSRKDMRKNDSKIYFETR